MRSAEGAHRGGLIQGGVAVVVLGDRHNGGDWRGVLSEVDIRFGSRAVPPRTLKHLFIIIISRCLTTDDDLVAVLEVVEGDWFGGGAVFV